MAYHESDFNLCKTCWTRLYRPSKRTIKKSVLTTYEDMCSECGRLNRLVEYVWENDEDTEEE